MGVFDDPADTPMAAINGVKRFFALAQASDQGFESISCIRQDRDYSQELETKLEIVTDLTCLTTRAGGPPSNFRARRYPHTASLLIERALRGTTVDPRNIPLPGRQVNGRSLRSELKWRYEALRCSFTRAP